MTTKKRVKLEVSPENLSILESLRSTLGLDSNTAVLNYLIRHYGARAGADYALFMQQIGGTPGGTPSRNVEQELPTTRQALEDSRGVEPAPHEEPSPSPKKGNRMKGL